MPRRLEPFVTADETAGHAGLGLTICRDLITSMDGEFLLEPVEGGLRVDGQPASNSGLGQLNPLSGRAETVTYYLVNASIYLATSRRMASEM